MPPNRKRTISDVSNPAEDNVVGGKQVRRSSRSNNGKKNDEKIPAMVSCVLEYTRIDETIINYIFDQYRHRFFSMVFKIMCSLRLIKVHDYSSTVLVVVTM